MSVNSILDCDTGVDTMAILHAALNPDIELLGVGTVWGNVDVATATRNTLHILEMAGRHDVPVPPGAAGPLLDTPAEFTYFVHGEDGQGNAYDGAAVGPAAATTAAQQIIGMSIGDVNLAHLHRNKLDVTLRAACASRRNHRHGEADTHGAPHSRQRDPSPLRADTGPWHRLTAAESLALEKYGEGKP
jgi:inosine-uridine nucleoside N-ribohydrolase